MDQRPHLPGTLARCQEVRFDLVADNCKGVSIHKSKVSEKHTHKDGAPDDLIDCNFRKNRNSIGSGDLLIEPIVEVMAGWAVVNEAEEGKCCEALPINGTSSNEDLLKQ